MNDVKLTLNIRQPPATSDAVTKAATKKKAAIETIEDAWDRILAMKNSEADVRRLHAVKRGMESGQVGRIRPISGSRRPRRCVWRVLTQKYKRNASEIWSKKCRTITS